MKINDSLRFSKSFVCYIQLPPPPLHHMRLQKHVCMVWRMHDIFFLSFFLIKYQYLWRKGHVYTVSGAMDIVEQGTAGTGGEWQPVKMSDTSLSCGQSQWPFRLLLSQAERPDLSYKFVAGVKVTVQRVPFRINRMLIHGVWEDLAQGST